MRDAIRKKEREHRTQKNIILGSIIVMDCNLEGLYHSREWRRKNLTGYLAFNDGTELSDSQVRKVVRCALSAGLTKASQLDDEVVKQWLNFKSE